MRKQTISFLLSLVLLLNLLPVSALAVGPDSGRVGSDITWTIDRETGVLSFEGSGQMYHEETIFDSAGVLWWRDGELIREIRFDERIGSIAPRLFSLSYFASVSDMHRLRNVRTVRIPAGVSRIGFDAFRSCTRLEEIAILNPDCAIEIGEQTLGIPGQTVVAGYPGSTAERFAQTFGYEFRSIGCADDSHVYADTVITPQTCTQDGVKESECVICHYKTRSPIPASHDYVITESLARTVYTCTRCGDSYVAGESVRLKLEQYTNITVQKGAYLCASFIPEVTDYYYFASDQSAARQAYGYEESYAQIYDSAGRPVGTELDDGLLKAGETYYYRISQVYDDTLPASVMVGIVHQFECTETTATCTRPGISSYTCIHCGESYTSEEYPLGHDYVETVTVEPTCTQTGLATHTCSRCGEHYTSVLPIAHQYVYDVNLPWYQHAVCTVCGDVGTFGSQNPPVLQLDRTEEARFDAADKQCAFRFTPDRDEFYVLRTGLRGNFIGRIYTAGGDPTGSYGSDPTEVFGALYKGETYYLVLRSDGDFSEPFSVTMEVMHDYWTEVTTPASCTSEGVMTTTCSFCGDSFTETIPEAHEWMYDVMLPWYEHGTCLLCGKEGEFGSKTPPAIELGREETVQFDEAGRAVFAFTPESGDCYELRFTEEYEADFSAYDPDGDYLAWGYSSVEVFLEAGKTGYFVVRTQEPDREAPPVIVERVHEYRYIYIREPDCTESGLKVGVCIHCGETVQDQIEPRHQYDFDVGLPWYEHAVCRSCGEAFEWGDPTPPEIALDTVVRAENKTTGRFGFYRFTPDTTGRYRFDFGDVRDVRCDVYSGGGDLMGTVVSDNTYGYSLLTCDLHAGWTYYLSPRFLNTDRTGEIPLSIRFAEAIPETELRLDQAEHVELDFLNTSAYFKITPPRDGYYSFRSSDSFNTDPFARLVDASGRELIHADDAYFDMNFNFRYPLQAGQSYYLIVQDLRGETGGFNVIMQTADSPYDAAALTLNRIAYAHVSEPGERVMFSFTPKVSGSYDFVSESGFDTFCALYDDKMNFLDFSDDSDTVDFRLVTLLEAGQTYYFEVSGYGFEVGTIPVILRRTTFWSMPEYWWINEGTVAAECYNLDNPSVRMQETADAVRVVLREPTYAAAGEAIHIASFRNAVFQTQTWVERIPRLIAPDLPCDGIDCPGSQFSDLPDKGHWAHDAIDWALVNGITTGTSADRFSPDAGCTRAQVVTFLWRAAGEPVPADGFDPFFDTDPNAYYYNAMLWALEEGITTGTSEERFSPDAACTRAQIATFLWRFEGAAEPGRAAGFTDVPEGAYYEKAVAWAAERGITAGTGDGKFSPGSTCTRAQVVTFLHRDLV